MTYTDDLSDDVGLRAAYAAHGSELYRFALRGLGDAGLAQDAVQETFLRAWRAADKYDPALASLRASPSTVWPAPCSSRTTAEPMKPVAPVTKTRI